MFCSSCGTQIENTAQFCPKCGTKFVQIPSATDGSTIAPPPPPQVPVATPPLSGIPSKVSSRAVTSLVLGILGITCCGILAPIAWVIGSMELKDIKSGLSSSEGKGYATAGQILGIVGTVLLILGMFWVILWFIFGFSTFALKAPMFHFRHF